MTGGGVTTRRALRRPSCKLGSVRVMSSSAVGRGAGSAGSFGSGGGGGGGVAVWARSLAGRCGSRRSISSASTRSTRSTGSTGSSGSRRRRGLPVQLVGGRVDGTAEAVEHLREVARLGRDGALLDEVDDVVALVLAHGLRELEDGGRHARLGARRLHHDCRARRRRPRRERGRARCRRLGRLDEHLERLAREEAADTALAHAVRSDDARVEDPPRRERARGGPRGPGPQTAAGWPRFTTAIVSSSSCAPSSV